MITRRFSFLLPFLAFLIGSAFASESPALTPLQPLTEAEADAIVEQRMADKFQRETEEYYRLLGKPALSEVTRPRSGSSSAHIRLRAIEPASVPSPRSVPRKEKAAAAPFLLSEFVDQYIHRTIFL